MKYFKYGILGLAILWISVFLTFYVGHLIGVGVNEIGYVIAAVSLLNATIAICTAILFFKIYLTENI